MYKVTVHVPEDFGDAVREIIGGSPASFISAGVDGEESEEHIEFLCHKDSLSGVVEQIKNINPYEDISVDIYKIESMHD
jgi:hypothetical protein